MCAHLLPSFPNDKAFLLSQTGFIITKIELSLAAPIFIWQIKFKNEEAVVAEEEGDGEISILTESTDYQKL